MTRWRFIALAVTVVCGLGFVAAAVTSDGDDLRPAGGDLNSVLADRANEVEQRREKAAELQAEVDALTGKVDDEDLQQTLRRVAKLQRAAGLTEVKGPGVRVTLDDAPRSVEAPGLDPNLLVVHQQDLQAFINALWAGGAEAVTLQGQRLVSTTGIKCVGNTVVLDGVPYSPPYVIEAVGDPYELNRSLNQSPEVVIYEDYAQRYELGLERKDLATVTAPAFTGSTAMTHARPIA